MNECKSGSSKQMKMEVVFVERKKKEINHPHNMLFIYFFSFTQASTNARYLIHAFASCLKHQDLKRKGLSYRHLDLEIDSTAPSTMLKA